jgi:hypothetical protein
MLPARPGARFRLPPAWFQAAPVKAGLAGNGAGVFANADSAKEFQILAAWQSHVIVARNRSSSTPPKERMRP